jgi:hypothetical protein
VEFYALEVRNNWRYDLKEHGFLFCAFFSKILNPGPSLWIVSERKNKWKVRNFKS